MLLLITLLMNDRRNNHIRCCGVDNNRSFPTTRTRCIQTLILDQLLHIDPQLIVILNPSDTSIGREIDDRRAEAERAEDDDGVGQRPEKDATPDADQPLSRAGQQ